MARLSIEECWWTDSRRSALIRLLGTENAADACAIRAWRLGQEFWKHNQGLVPLALFDLLEGRDALVKVGLAEVREAFVYVRGSSTHLDWARKQREDAATAGKKSAEARRKRAGSAQPKQKKPRTTTERPSNDARTKTNEIEPSVSVSGFNSGSVRAFPSEKANELALVPEPRGISLEEIKNPVAIWCSEYSRAYGTKYLILERDGGMLKNFAKGRSMETMQTLFACYFAIKEKFYCEQKHPLSLFFRDLPKIVSASQTGVDPSAPSKLDYSFLKD